MLTDNVRITIRAVKGKREDLIQRLIGQLGTLEHRISWHRPGRTVLQSYTDAISVWSDKPLKWLMQFEDDAVICDGFERIASDLIRSAEEKNLPFISFYSGRRVKPGEVLPSPPILEVIPGSKFLMAQCVAIRSDFIPSLVQFVSDYCEGKYNLADVVTALWMKGNRMRYGRSWPSIVQHSDNRQSLQGHKWHPNRVSESFNSAFER